MVDAAAPQHLRWKDFYKNNTKKIKKIIYYFIFNFIKTIMRNSIACYMKTEKTFFYQKNYHLT